MPIKSKRELICQRCGKVFIVECGDNITVKDLRRLSNRLCLKCKILSIFKNGTNRES